LSENIGAFAVSLKIRHLCHIAHRYVQVVYGIFISFGEFGPGNNLGLLASKSCPTAIRGHFYGIAAAIVKIGAFIGTWGEFGN
jgi:hypothetical protein